MPDSFDLLFTISAALESFDWGHHGYEDVGIDMATPSLDIKDELAVHILWSVENLLGGK